MHTSVPTAAALAVAAHLSLIQKKKKKKNFCERSTAIIAYFPTCDGGGDACVRACVYVTGVVVCSSC